MPPPPPTEGPILTATLAGKQPEQTDTLLYHIPIEWAEGYTLGTQLEIPAQPPIDAVVKFAIPAEAMAGQTFRLTLTLPKPKPNTFQLRGLHISTRPPSVVVEVVKEMRVSGTSCTRPPIPHEEAFSRLASIGYTLKEAAPNGDCFYLSAVWSKSSNL